MAIEPWIRTRSGGRFYPLDPDPADVKIEDIAHALSNVCRYTGHCREFYSVAQHSMYVARRAADLGDSPALAIHGLLHDAAEAYLPEVSAPIKWAFWINGSPFDEVEARVLSAVYTALEIPEPTEEERAAVRQADLEVLAAEASGLGMNPEDWKLPYAPPEGWRVNQCYRPVRAFSAFISDFRSYLGRLGAR